MKEKREQEAERHKQEEEKRRLEKERHEHERKVTQWIEQGLCRFCGGQVGGLFVKKCKSCGKTR